MKAANALLTVVLALVLASPVAARPPAADGARAETQWATVLLAGRKVGHMRVDRELAGDRVVTRQFMTFELGRAGISMTMSTLEEHEESVQGEPLGFTSVSTISGLEMRSEGRRTEGNRFVLRSGAPGALRESGLDWPEGALLAWGMERQLRAMGQKPGAATRLRLFQPMLNQAIAVDVEIVGPATVSLPDGPAELVETRQTMHMPGTAITSRSWMDPGWQMRRMIMEVMGERLEVLACDQACAEAPNQPAEILTTSLVQAPAPIDPELLDQPLQLQLESDVDLGDWPGIDGQRLIALGAGRYLLETRSSRPDPVPPPDANDSRATDWLDFDSGAVRALLDGNEPEGDNIERMLALQDLVQRHIRRKSLNIGYASAGDAARLREGDCTEHALLLAALGRAVGIPTRVVNGLAYTAEFEGIQAVFVPHAWVAAWTGEHWQAFDAALPGRQLRIALHAGDGDPWRFYRGVEAFGRLRITGVQGRAEEATASGRGVP